MADWRKVYQSRIPEVRREIPSPTWVFENGSNHHPESELEALMVTPPGGHPPQMPPENDGDMWDNLDEMLGVQLELNEDEKAVMEARAVSGLSIRETAEILGLSKSSVDRIEKSVLARVRNKIEEHRYDD